MRPLTVHVEGQGYRGSWDTWEDDAWGRMVQATHEGWSAQGPVRDEDPERVAMALLQWCVARRLHGVRGGRPL